MRISIELYASAASLLAGRVSRTEHHDFTSLRGFSRMLNRIEGEGWCTRLVVNDLVVSRDEIAKVLR